MNWNRRSDYEPLSAPMGLIFLAVMALSAWITVAGVWTICREIGHLVRWVVGLFSSALWGGSLMGEQFAFFRWAVLMYEVTPWRGKPLYHGWLRCSCTEEWLKRNLWTTPSLTNSYARFPRKAAVIATRPRAWPQSSWSVAIRRSRRPIRTRLQLPMLITAGGRCHDGQRWRGCAGLPNPRDWSADA